MVLSAGLAQASLDQMPSCAMKCFEATLPTTKCASDDMSCLCADSVFLQTAAACNSANCTMVEVLSATNTTYAACGIPIRDQSGTLIGVTASFFAVSIIMVTARLLDRGLSSTARLGWDDLLIGLSALAGICFNVPIIVGGAYGFGRDIWGIQPNDITTCLHWLFFAYPFYMVTEAFCQLSILAFYLRIMTDRMTRKIVWSFIVLVASFGVGNLFSMIFQCWPISFFWEGWKGEMIPASQIDMNLFSFVRGGLEIVVDLIILALPLPMLLKLQMKLQKKLQILSMFCVGFVITGVSIARLHALIEFSKTTNPTYDNTPTIYWCSLEANLFIVVACMPAVHAIFQKVWKRAFGRNASNGYGSSNKNSYFSNHGQKSGASLPFGKITKSTDVQIYHSDRVDRSDRSDSDVELVDR